MGGSGTVLGAARAIAELKPNVEVHFIVASCENMVSANAYRPGDIITASNGKTIEVGNTDAGTFPGGSARGGGCYRHMRHPSAC